MKTGHADKARELFNDGYNCSQAVLGAFAEDAGLDVKTAQCARSAAASAECSWR